MKKTLLFLLFTFLITNAFAQWKPAPYKILTPWAEELSVENVHKEYPRPQMEREQWINLNGLWNYSITPVSEEAIAFQPQGKILVPFAVESSLSGVGRTVGKDSLLWYNKSFTLKNSEVKNKKVLLHFGAVDWKAEVYLNGTHIGSHEGGYDPFSFDITGALKKSGLQQLVVKVWDPTDAGPQPRGKQVKNPSGIWYTPVTGIWQTVWLEVLPTSYIEAIRQTPDIDNQSVSVTPVVQNLQVGDRIKILVSDNGEIVAEKELSEATTAIVQIPSPKLWSPDSPFLYDITYILERKGKAIDRVKSYFGMRKISMEKDANGIQRLLLNNEFLFQYGPLDQGWWPDGLYTAPSDEALKFDVLKTKEMGFNMIRKHVKVEPARWYYHCDKEGVLVWQDMPSGDLGNRWDIRPFILGKAADKDRSAESEHIFKTEWKAIMNALHIFPSIIMWVPFNEAWGQFKTEEIVKMTAEADPSRLINAASGGNFVHAGHIVDFHNYPEPQIPDPAMFGREMAVVLGEFGGLGLPLEGHTWQLKNWGYQSFGTRDSLRMRYEDFINRVENFIPLGLAAAVYTQTTDVEGETNGLMTYDRKVFKIPVEKLAIIHKKLYNRQLFPKNR